MTTQMTTTSGSALDNDSGNDGGEHRPLRADAQRNHDRLVASAKTVFARCGGDASMESIAKEAGVGIGTLYRHFPRRIDLVEAVYKTDVDELIVAADRCGAEHEPWSALVEWLEAFVRYAQSKRTFLTELQEAFAKHPELKLASRGRIDEAMARILGRAQAAGAVRPDVDGGDLMQLLGPMCSSPTLADGQAARLLAMIIDGLRPPVAN